MLENQALGQIVDDIVNNANLLESALDLEMVPPDDISLDLLEKFRSIIAQLDKETRQVQKQTRGKEVKTEYKLRPSSTSDTGFQEGITLLAQ